MNPALMMMMTSGRRNREDCCFDSSNISLKEMAIVFLSFIALYSSLWYIIPKVQRYISGYYRVVYNIGTYEVVCWEDTKDKEGISCYRK